LKKPARYDYEVFTEKLDPPIGGLRRYAATVILTRLHDNRPSERIAVDGLGEMWGNTEQEAYQKMRQAVEDWISQQSEKATTD